MRRVGLAVARGVVTALLGDPAEAAALLRAHRHDAPGLGGSGAQRDLLARIAVDAALAAGDGAGAEAMLLDRALERVSGAWEASRLGRIARLRRQAARPRALPAAPILLRVGFA
jgi:hypothetical protein